MKKLLIYLMSLSIVVASIVGCSKDDSTPEIPEPTISLQVDEAEVTQLDLGCDIGSTKSFTVVTNQEESTITASVDTASKSWCSASVSGTTVTITATDENPLANHSAIITVTAGEGDYEISAKVTVVQDTSDATISVAPTAVTLDNELGATTSVEVTTNQEESTITAEVSDEDNFKVTVDGTTVTVEALSVNTSATDMTATVTVKAGTSTNYESTTFGVTQDNSYTFDITPTSVEVAYSQGAYATVQVSTNLLSIEANVDSGYESLFSASVDGMKVTITALTENATDVPIVGSVTISSGDAMANVSITQLVIPALTTISIGDEYDGGVVYWIADDCTQIKIVSKEEATLAYSTDTSTIYYDTLDDDDGEANTAAILALDTYDAEVFPAIAWCVALGEGWYLPSVNECETLVLMTNEGFNDSLIAKSAAEIQDNTYYWTSTGTTTIETKVYATKVKDGEPMSGEYVKSKERPIRAIKLVQQ